MGSKVWLDNQLLDEADAKISVFDHGLLYGDGVFEGIRVYSGKVFEFQAHLDRLYRSARALRLPIDQDKETMMANVETTAQANNIKDGYIRLIATRGVGDLGLDPTICKKAQIIIIAATIQLYPKEFYEKGLKVISSSVVRNHPLSLSPQIKSLNYLNNIMAKLEAVDRGMPEAIMYNHMGYIAEATGDNVFIIREGVIYTPPSEAGALEGITRSVVIRLAREHGYEVIERNLVRFDLYAAEEIFLTGTAAEVIGIVEVDHHKIGCGSPGPITRDLLKKFNEYVRQ